MERLDTRLAWLLLGAAALAASALILWQGRGLGISSDDLSYYSRTVAEPGGTHTYPGPTLEYLLAPHAGHLQLGGKLIYEAVFALFGPDYGALRVIELAGILACVALFFELARRRAGNAPALAAAVLLLGLGAAWEVMLWPFDLHTVYALGFGLAALLALERGDGRGHLAACLLLIGSVVMIELGLAMVAAAAVMVAARRDWASRAWVVLAPLAVYAAWALWARRFDQSEFMPSGAVGTLGSVFDSAKAVIASLTGLYGHAPDVYAAQVGPDAAAAVPAALALAALVAFYLITRPPARAWAMLAALAVYWGFIALADRPEDLSRYMFGGALLLLLVAAEAAGGRVRPLPLTAALAALLIVSLPASLAKIADGRELQLSDTRASRSEYAMLELAGDRAPPGYTPALDPAVRGAAPAPFSGLDAASYRRAARDVGSLAYPLDELRALPQDYREAADITLAEALGLERRVRHAGAPADASGCREADTQAVELPAGGALVRALGGDPATLSVARFAPESAGVRIGTAPPGRWTAIELPPDAAPDPWLLRADHALRVCPTRRV